MKKEENILELFLNEPTKHWHFEELVKRGKVSRPQTNDWLKIFLKEGLIQRIKEKKKMPYYIANYQSPSYHLRKKMYAIEQMNKTGFLKHLLSLPKVKNIIIFGSFSRWDWYKESDIDLFIYGDSEGLKILPFRKKLRRDIEVFHVSDLQKLKKMPPALLKNIIEGYHLKGKLSFLEVKAHV
ncbi:MAG: hypothetical protein QT08_C0019G0007 [archaeon GW2011_AR17]|nr:MAG: hypothetical protein QT08_C0019G0007 [archaeon GW2011_AR17]MBS3154710.1 nucleotidyltransferase domain-containing protein [Candidatus Woesearchaeota archaeon]HIH15741.1 nucleotidyltransferase domain-containing protein [Nanoarchaeota archaeon]HIH58447.1 nucleotidyltransferase domain-containing protein [Nanoarchaeota archaeon]HII13703.1 nucleotidyltransferase domain-containing protein [Nanoarchaeota archaeon]